MRQPLVLQILVTTMLWLRPAVAAEVITNSIRFAEAPAWITESLLEKASRPVQDYLQWDIRRIQAFYHADAKRFQALHGAGPTVKAFFRRSSNPPEGTLHLGPDVTPKNFGPILSHELVHAIFFQKYKEAIPKWLEEGLANYLSKLGPVDYKWLARQPTRDIRSMTHPLQDPLGLKFHYQTSTAVTEMIAAKCSLHDLLHLSVGRKLETHLSILCETPDVNAAYRAWLKKKSRM